MWYTDFVGKYKNYGFSPDGFVDFCCFLRGRGPGNEVILFARSDLAGNLDLFAPGAGGDGPAGWRPGELGAAAGAGACLLYTSRCV